MLTYEEATVYAEVLGKSLPTPAQFEKAARGTEGLKYPWGNEVRNRVTNTKESGIGKLTSVDAYAAGTRIVAGGLAECAGVTVVGGGDSVAAVNELNLADRFDHVSTGGGASLEYLQGLTLPGVAALEN